jgi:hypothetical protein
MPVIASMGSLAYSRTTPGPYIPYIGEFIYGGYYAGIYQNKYLIVADKTTEGANQYNASYLACENLVSNGYSDWTLPVSAMYPVMNTARFNPSWPSSQAYNVSATPLRNYWVNSGYPKNNPSELIPVYIFATSSYSSNYPTNVFSYRAVRLVTP